MMIDRNQITFPQRMPVPDQDVLWRIKEQYYSVCINADGDTFGKSPLYVEARWYPVTRRTPKGAWIGGKFVKLNARKKYACETLEDAIESFIARKEKQVKILTAQLETAKLALSKVKAYSLGGTNE